MLTALTLFICKELLFFCFILCAFAFILFIALPYLRIYSYKKKGFATYFFPILGLFYKVKEDAHLRNDAMISSKESSRLYPGQQYVISNLGHQIIFTLRDPQYFKDFTLKQHLYKKGRFIQVLSVLTKGLILREGENWKRHRKIVSTSFNYDFLKRNIVEVQDTVREFFDKVTPDDYNNYSLLERLHEITGEIVGRIFFGKNFSKYSCDGKPLTLALADLYEELGIYMRSSLIVLFGPKLLYVPIIPKFRRYINKIKEFKKISLSIIKDRKENPIESSDLLGLLLATQKFENPEERMSDEEIVEEFTTFFGAGMDTSAHLVEMTLYNLSKYPQYLQLLQEERDALYNKENKINIDTLQNMNVMHSILKETLRFYTPAPAIAPREALIDHDILDLKIKKGDLVRLDMFSVLFNEKYFANPIQFIPERWNSSQKIDPFAFIPFSSGPRNCLGQHLAMIEAKIIVSEFLERFNFKLKEGYNLKMTFRLVYKPHDNILLDLAPKYTR